MRNKTFISSMVLSVVCVSAANAGVVDPFTTTQTPPPPYGTFINISGGLFNQRALVKTGNGSGSVSGGSVNFVADSASTNAGMAFGLEYKQANGSTIDLSGKSFSFNLAATGSYTLLWVFVDGNENSADMVVSAQSGIVTFSATQTEAGFDWSNVETMNVGFRHGSSSTGVLSNFNFTAVPAPGALALLGVAGLVGARRRRA